MVPEDRELDRQDHSTSVGSARSRLVGISSSPARSSLCHTGNGSHAVHRCVQLGLGSPTRLTLDSGTVVSISKIVAHKRSGDAGHHQRSEGLPASSEVQSGSIDVRQCGHGCLHQERMGHMILHSHAADDTPAEVVRWQGDQAGASPSTRSEQRPGRCTLNTEWTLATERLRPVFTKWGEPQIDMFATFTNRQLIKFVSPYSDPRAEWTDTMSTTLDN